MILSIDDRRMIVHFIILPFSGESVKVHQQSFHISMPQYYANQPNFVGKIITAR